MARLADYSGNMLNHAETLYQRGERELAIRFFEALGCAVVDTGRPCETGATYLTVHPDPDERDLVNNVLYLSEVRDAQWALDQALVAALADEAAPLARARAGYLHKARTAPHGITHLGLRYSSFASLDVVLDRLERDLDPALVGRVEVGSVIRPGDRASMTDELVQAFVVTDVVAAGLFAFGQLFELQAQQLVGAN